VREARPSDEAVGRTLDRTLACFAEVTARGEWRKADAFIRAAIELSKVLGEFGKDEIREEG
jgi:hypothetical protein